MLGINFSAARGIDLVLRDVTLGARGPVDVAIVDGVIAAIGSAIAAGGAREIRGSTVLPGLHDHHLHLLAIVAARGSVACGRPDVVDRESLAAALRAVPGTGWIRGVDYDEATAGELNRDLLDALVADRPLRIQHRGGALWTLNTQALELLDVGARDHPGVERDGHGRATGRLWRMDAWLGTALGERDEPDLTDLGRELAALGITGVTDATPGPTDALARAAMGMPQRVLSMGEDPGGRLGRGPYKIVLSDHALPALDELSATIARVHSDDRPVAVHSVTRESLFLSLAALDAAGSHPGDRIEHAAVAPPEAVASLARLGIAVVTQPSLVTGRGDDYLARVEPRDLPDLWRYRSLLSAGVRVGLSSDAPYGDVNPWHTIDAAARRTTPSGAVLGVAEAVSSATALSGFLAGAGAPGGAPREIHVGADADLIVLDCSIDEMLARPDEGHIQVTLIGGEPVYVRDDADAY